MPTFGGTSKVKPPRHEFTFIFQRNEQDEPHTFGAYAKVDTLALTRVMRGAEDPAQAVKALFSFVGGMLDDEDGMPSSWKPKPVVRLGPGPEDDESNLQEEITAYRGPDGEHIPADELDKALVRLTLERGSSRRRWYYLVYEDNELAAEQKDLQALFEWLVSLGGKGTTPARR